MDNPQWDLTEVQTTALALRGVLRDLGTPEERLRMIIPRGDQHVYIPALPLDVVQHLVRLLPAPPAPREHP